MMTEDKHEYSVADQYMKEEKKGHPNSNRSTSRNACGIPKLDLSQVGSKKDLDLNNQDGIFNQEPLLDLSTKRIQNLMMTTDLTSMLKAIREAISSKVQSQDKEGSNSKVSKDRRISPRACDLKDLELEKWVEKSDDDPDNSKRIYEENKKKTEEIMKETMGIENLISKYELTQDALKKIFSEKITTPREGLSFRSGFNSSRRLYERSQTKKNADDESEKDYKERKHHRSTGSIKDLDNIIVSSQEDEKEGFILKQKIEKKIKAQQEVTFETKDDHLFQQDDGLNNNSIDIIDAFRDKKLDKKRSLDDLDYPYSSDESPIDIDNGDNNKFSSKTPNIFEDSEEILESSGKKKSLADNKDTSKSLEIASQYKRNKKEEVKGNNNNDDTNSNSVSLIRIKSEHNLNEEKEIKGHNLAENKKEKTYNSKNFFTENFDDQEMEDAINKIKNNPDFDPSSPSPDKPENTVKADEKDSDQNIDFCPEEESISFDENNWKIDLGQTLNRNNEDKIKAIIESANADYNNLITSNVITQPNSGAILVNDNEDDNTDVRMDPSESSNSDKMEINTPAEEKKGGFVQVKSKFDNLNDNQKIDNLFESTKDETKGKGKENFGLTKHSKSVEDLQGDALEDSN